MSSEPTSTLDPSVPWFFLIGRLLGIRLVYVESVTRTSEAIQHIAASTTEQQDAAHAFDELITSLDPGRPGAEPSR